MIGDYTARRLRRLLKSPADVERVRRVLAPELARIRPAARKRRRRPRAPFTIARAILASGHDLTLARVVAEHIEYVLRIVDGNLSDAARLLGVNRRTLQRRN